MYSQLKNIQLITFFKLVTLHQMLQFTYSKKTYLPVQGHCREEMSGTEPVLLEQDRYCTPQESGVFIEWQSSVKEKEIRFINKGL